MKLECQPNGILWRCQKADHMSVSVWTSTEDPMWIEKTAGMHTDCKPGKNTEEKEQWICHYCESNISHYCYSAICRGS